MRRNHPQVLLSAWSPLACLLSTAILLAGPCAGEAAGADAALTAAADVMLQPLVDLGVFQGAVLVARGDRVLIEKGYGFANVELGVPNTPERVFRIASLSKPFTEVALGRLIEAGKLDLDTPLARFLPAAPSADRITLRMLLTHRAGIPSRNSIPYDEEARQPNTLDSLVQVLVHQPLDFEPGTQRRYSNGGYALLAYVIEQCTGKTYADFLRSEVLEPLGLARTRHEEDGMVVPGRAYGYMPSGRDRRGLVLAPFQQMATKTGGGSLVSTVDDLHRFLRAAYRDNVLRVATWRELLPQSDSTLTFQGRCPGYNVYMTRDFAHDLDVVVLSNNYASGTIASVASELAAVAQGGKPPAPRWRVDVAADAVRSHACAGIYKPPAGALPYGDWNFDVRWEGGELVLYRDRTPLDVLLPQSNGAFLLRNMVSELRFLPEGGPAVQQATVTLLWVDRSVTLQRLVRP
jgi:CubicO group peptidase (beta-lactamase class C family)